MSTANSIPGAQQIGAASVDAESPWLGLASFTEETRGYFCGREAEVAELTRRVQRKLLTVLFGKSGLGKTSILRAGLVPQLRAQGYFPVYLRIDYGRDSPEPSEQIKQAINHAARDLQSAGIQGVAAEESIWEFLHHRDDVPKDAAGTKLIPLLIFDQFEELFTLAQSDEFGRTRAARFVEELADLVENRPPKALEARLDADDSIAERFDFARSDYRVVIALREDYLAPLESLKKVMPSLSQNRLRLAPMTGTQALQAVLRPGKQLVSQEVAEAIVRFVAGGSELANAEVEPSLLSLICRELNEQRIAQHRSEISQDLLAGSHDTILSTFYERSLADQPESVRRIIEDDLLTESGYRENLAEESLLKRFQAAGAAADALAKLVNHRLLRIEERLDVRRVELTHDVLTGVVKASRDQRHEREAQAATERTLAEQRQRELAARQALRRARTVATGCTLLALVAIVAAGAAFFSVQRARRAEQLAQQTRAISEQARQQAEGLLGFLTDDFVNELDTFGRYQTVAELTQREIDYFQHLPPQLKDFGTVRGGALALVNSADAHQYIGDFDTAERNAADAVTLLQSLQHDGDRSDATTIVLGRAYTTLGLILAIKTDPRAAVNLERAVAILRPVGLRAGASAEARLAYVHALTWVGWEDQGGSPEEGIRVEREAMRLAAQLSAGHNRDFRADADYAMAGTWLVNMLAQFGRNDEARQVGEDALAVADRVLAQRPQFGYVLDDEQNLEGELALSALRSLNPAAALDLEKRGQQFGLAVVRLEPGNTIYLNDLASTYSVTGLSLWSAGRLHEAIGYLRKAIAAFAEAAAGRVFQLRNANDLAAITALLQAQTGDLTGAAATLAAGETFVDPGRLRALGVGASFTGVSLRSARAKAMAEVAYQRGDFDAARHLAGTARSELQASHPGEADQIFTMKIWVCLLSDVEGRAAYQLGDFTAAEAALRRALSCTQMGVIVDTTTPERKLAAFATWLSMTLTREGKRQEAAQTIAPVVQMYRDLEKKNHGDQWLPLEFAEALYAQSLTDAPHRAALLREAMLRVDHLIPAIANLHDTREWRARIEAAQRTAGRATP